MDEDFRPGSLDDIWFGTEPTEETSANAAPRSESLPPPTPAPRRQGSDYSRFVEENQPSFDRLPSVYREGAKNIYKRRQPEAAFNPGSLDDYDWGESSSAVSGEPAYDPTDDWAITRGFKVASDQGTKSITAIGDMTRILGLKTTEEQVAEALKIGRETDDPSAPKLAIKGFTDVDSFGEGLSYAGEAFGQMLGSMWAAATTGGAAGAASGAAVGGVAGAAGLGAGAVPGAVAGGLYGFTRGTLGSFMAMGVGGTFRELLQDKGVQEGLENGSIKVDDIYRWAMTAGGLVGALDAVPIANRWMEVTGGKKLAIDTIKASVKKAAVKGAVRGGLEEGVTEGIQGAISEFSQAVVGGNVDLAERSYAVIDQFLSGAIGGAPLGAIGGYQQNKKLPERAETVYPAGTSGPRSQPGGFAPGIGPTGGLGSSGPGTGYSTKPTPPPDAGTRGRDYGKTRTGAPVTATPVGETDADIAEALGFEEETPTGEVRPIVVPQGKRKRTGGDVDVDVSAALTPETETAATTEAEAGGQPPLTDEDALAKQRAADAVSPWPKRTRRPAPGPEIPDVTEQPTAVEPEQAEEVVAPTVVEEEVVEPEPEPAPVEEVVEPEPVIEPEPEVIEEPEPAPVDDDEAMQQIIGALQSMGVPTKGSLSAALNSVGRRLGVPNLSKATPADIVAFLRENGVAIPEPQRESGVEITPEIQAELDAIAAAEAAVSPWRKRKPKEKVAPPVEEAAPEVEEEPEEKPYRGLRKLQAFAEALRPTKYELETGRYERQLKMEGREQADTRKHKPLTSKQRKKLEAKPIPTKEVERYDVTAITSAKDKLTSLVKSPKQYRYLWERIAPDLQVALGESWHPDAKLAKRPAPPQKPAKKRAEAKAPVPEPVKKKRAPRAAIALPAAPAPAVPKPKTTKARRTIRVTPHLLESFREGRKAALERLVGEVIRHRKSRRKAGTVTDVTYEGETVTAEREPRPELTVAGKTYESTDAFNVARKKARGEKSRRAFSDAYSSRAYSALQRWEQTEPESRTEEFPEGRLVISVGGKEQTVTSEELLDNYVVDITTTEERVEEARTPPVAKTTARSRLAKHFRYGSKEPVLLSSVGMNETDIAQLERAGFAEDGSMSLEEFQRWTRKAPVKETGFRERRFEGRRIVTDVTGVPETERVVTATQKAKEAVRIAMRRGRAKAEAIAEAEREQAEAKKVKAKTPTEKMEAAVKKKLMEPRPSGRTKGVLVEPYAFPSTATQEERTARRLEQVPVPISAVMSHEPTAAELAKEAVAFIEAGGKPKTLADAIDAAFTRAMQAAEKKIKDLYAAAEKAAVEHAEALQKAKEALGPAPQSVRRGKFKPVETVKREDPKTTFRNAKEAYFADEAKGVVKPKPDDEAQAILWEMGELKAKVSKADKEGRKANRSHIRHWNAMYNVLNTKRENLLATLERAETKQADYWDEQTAKMRLKYHEWLNRLVEEGKLTADEAHDIRNSFIAHDVMVKKKRRTRVTDPAIKKVLREMPPPPQDLTTEEVSEISRQIREKTKPKGWPRRIRYTPVTVLNMRIRQWAEDFIKAVDKEIREANRKIRNPKARVKLPHRANRFNNSAEENMVQFVRGRLGKLEDAETQRQDNYYQLGQNVHDAWWAASLLHPRLNRRKPGVSEHQHYLNQVQREEELYAQMFDASKTAETVAGVRELGWVTDLAEQRQELHEQFGETVAPEQVSETLREAVRQSTADTAIAEQLRKIFESPHTVESRHGGPTETMTGAEAMSRFTKTPKGSFRSAISAALTRLVGDTPVHFISDAAMREMRGRSAPGFYDFDNHTIYLNQAMREHPDLLADTVIHEMAHAATVYAFEHNLRGANEIFNTILKGVRKQATITDEVMAHYLKKPEELIAGFTESSRLQKMLKSMPVPLRDRAALRALARGRPMATMWDYIMAAVENAVGVFTPAGRRSYFDEIFSLFPDVAMSTAEQRAEEAVRGRRAPEIADENAIFEHPFDINNVKAFYDRAAKGQRSFKGRQFFNLHIAPMEYLKRDIAERYFNGEFNNPISRFIDHAILRHTRSVEDEMRAGLEIDNRLRRWASVNPLERRDQLRDAIVNAMLASFDKVDPRITLAENKHIWDDAAHPLKSGKPRKTPTARHEASAGKRAAYARHRANWEAVPEDLKPIMSERMDHMKQALRDFDHDLLDLALEMLETKEVDAITLPSGMTRAEAADQLYRDEVTPELKDALGDNFKTIMKTAGRLAEAGGVYWPASRAGPFYISGRRRIALPEVEHGYVEIDKEAIKEDGRDQHFFVFTDIRDARDYIEEMGETGDEHIVSRQVRYINPITGEHVTHDDHGRIKGKDWEAEPRYYVEVQHRFMAMGETVDELEALRDQLEADPDKDYSWISQPMAMSINHTPDKAMVPSQLAAFHRNIDSMKGKSDAEKATLKSMATSTFIRTQQGNRLSKRMLRRTGVAGYETNNLDKLLATLNANNEMMSRHKVNRRRMVEIEKARKEAIAFIRAAGGRGNIDDPATLKKVPEHLRHLITRDYGKGGRAAQLSQDWETIERRYRQLLNPREVRHIPERFGNAVQSILVQTYLATPMYNVVNAMGYWLQSFPRIAGEIGISAALRYGGKADAYLSGMTGNKFAGFSEAVAEGKDFVTGFLPRQGYKYPRGFREQRNLFEEQMDRIKTGHPDDWHVPHLLAAAEEARLRNHVGQAGLDQVNLNTDLMKPGSMQKAMRGIESSQRVFRAMQEGIELDTRLKPMFTRLLYYLDTGMDPKQAIEKSVNEMVNDQTGYAKENWPAWMNAPVIRRIVMFKKFPIQQTLNFYRAMRQSAAGDTVAMSQLFYMAAALSMLGGAYGLPPWELVRLLMYMANLMGVPVPGNWNVAKSKMESALAGVVGERAAEAAGYGLPRLIGIDLSSRLALDSTLLFQQPKELTNDGIMAAVGKAVGGAPVSTGLAMMTAIRDNLVDDTNIPKFISQAPVPRFIKDIAKAYDTHVNGPTTKTGLQTGEAPGILSTLLASAGLRTRDQARPFEQGSAAQQLIKDEASANKSRVVRRILNEGLTAANMKRMQDWNAKQTDPKLKIKVKDISAARKRRTKREQEMQKQNLEAL